MGNSVIWKPASTAMLSGYYVLKLLEAAGLPPGVINFVPGDAAMISEILLSHRDLAGVHFTGSTGVFNSMWKTIGANMNRYRSYPRIVGETGGKDFIIAHRRPTRRRSRSRSRAAGSSIRDRSARRRVACTCRSRCGRRCATRPSAMIEQIRMGDVRDFRNFMGAVIDEKAFKKIDEYIGDAKKNARIVAGGVTKGDEGYFIAPTLVETDQRDYRLLCEEIFGPVVTAFVYDDSRVDGDARDHRRDVAVRAHRVGVLDGSSRDSAGEPRAAQRGRKLLHQRQADRRGGWPAAVRRRDERAARTTRLARS